MAFGEVRRDDWPCLTLSKYHKVVLEQVEQHMPFHCRRRKKKSSTQSTRGASEELRRHHGSVGSVKKVNEGDESSGAKAHGNPQISTSTEICRTGPCCLLKVLIRWLYIPGEPLRGKKHSSACTVLHSL